jgi:hypothetical protein
MRYEIGQKIPVISFIVKGKISNGGGAYSRSAVHFMPWDEQVESSEIVYLTVVEHHRVPNSYDQTNEPTCDGYILETAEGERWFNQYPRASYGQLSDAADRMFHRENFKGSKYRQYVSLVSYMENLLCGESQLIAEKPERANMLRTQYEELKSRYEELTGYVIVSQPLVFELNDGTKDILPGWFTITADLPSVIGKKLYKDFIETLDPKVPVAMPAFNIGLTAFVEAHTAHVLVKDAAFDFKDEQMLADCDGQTPQHSSW